MSLLLDLLLHSYDLGLERLDLLGQLVPLLLQELMLGLHHVHARLHDVEGVLLIVVELLQALDLVSLH